MEPWFMHNAATLRKPSRPRYSYNNLDFEIEMELFEEPSPITNTTMDIDNVGNVNPGTLEPSHNSRRVFTQFINQSREMDAEAATVANEDTSMDALNGETFGTATPMLFVSPINTTRTVHEDADAFNNETFGAVATDIVQTERTAPHELATFATQMMRMLSAFEAERAALYRRQEMARGAGTTTGAPADTFNDETFGPAPMQTQEQEGDFGMYARQTQVFAAATVDLEMAGLRQRAPPCRKITPMPRKRYLFR